MKKHIAGIKRRNNAAPTHPKWTHHAEPRFYAVQRGAARSDKKRSQPGQRAARPGTAPQQSSPDSGGPRVKAGKIYGILASRRAGWPCCWPCWPWRAGEMAPLAFDPNGFRLRASSGRRFVEPSAGPARRATTTSTPLCTCTPPGGLGPGPAATAWRQPLGWTQSRSGCRQAQLRIWKGQIFHKPHHEKMPAKLILEPCAGWVGSSAKLRLTVGIEPTGPTRVGPRQRQCIRFAPAYYSRLRTRKSRFEQGYIKTYVVSGQYLGWQCDR